MLRLYDRPTIQEISVITNKSKSVVLRMIDSLQEKGLVTRTVNPEDRREKFLEITELGKAISEQNLKIKIEVSRELLKGIPEEETKIFLRVVESITRNADELLKTK